MEKAWYRSGRRCELGNGILDEPLFGRGARIQQLPEVLVKASGQLVPVSPSSAVLDSTVRLKRSSISLILVVFVAVEMRRYR